MAFDQSTRNRLQRFVSDARALLTQEFTHQVQHEYGMDPATGEVADVDKLSHMDDTRRETAHLLRDTLNHYLATSPSGGNKETLERIVREQAFTVLNRLAALRMMEARGLLIESIARGYQSKGFQLYQRLAGSALGETGDAYRCYVFSLFDEFALDLAVLFDRFSPQGRLFPRESALLALFGLINHPEIESLWAEDETIGWIYQYYNSQEERRQMRADSPAPRNSRELAVRNQFFTPRYVVEFLTENTLGRLWYEMTQGQTGITDQCHYLVRRPNEIFLQSGEEAPMQEEPQEERSQEELLQQPVYIPFRVLKDPRDITMLDPACGSMHFGLYAFDLFEVIYDEAWEIVHGGDEARKSSASFAPFVAFVVPYPDKASFLADVPRLIIEHNLHGIDIDPRSVQISGLSLWLRAQRTWQQQGLRPQDRPRILRSNIACAESMPGEEAFLEEFIEAHLAATPERKLLGQLVRHVFDAMKLASEAGSLLKIEEEIAGPVAEAKQKWLAGPTPEQSRLFADDTAPPTQKELGLDVTRITDETFWEKAEERIYTAIQAYAEQAEHGGGYQRRLFADDAARGFAFIDLCRKRYDIVLMNPPFGASVAQAKNYLYKNYSRTKNDLYAAFVERGIHYLNDAGRVGTITSRTGFFLGTFQQWREKILLEGCRLLILADLGSEVLDDAVVEVASYVLEKSRRHTDSPATVFRLLTTEAKAAQLESATSGEDASYVFCIKPTGFRNVETSPFAYWIPEYIRARFSEFLTFEPTVGDVRCGLSTNDNPRFVRALWEIPPEDHFFCYYPIGKNRHFCSFDDPVVRSFLARRHRGKRIWSAHVMAGASQPWFSPMTVVVNWKNDGEEIKAYARFLGNSPSRNVRSEDYYFRPGISWTRRAVRMIPYVIPSNSIPTASRYMAFPNDGLEALALGFMSSNFASAYLRMFGEWFTRPNFLVDNLKSLPWSADLQNFKEEIEHVVRQEVTRRRAAYRGHEPFHEFTVPFGLAKPSDVNVSFNYESLLGEELDARVAATYHLSHSDFALLQRDVQEAVSVRSRAEVQKTASGSEMREDDDDDSVLDTSEPAMYETNLSYGVGCAFGRWDIWYATGEKPAPELPDPFEPLPVCPPGQLQNEQRLPISKEDVERLKEKGQWNYPIEIPWDGILVDAPGHPLDIEARVHQVLQVIWKDRWEAIEREAGEILGVRTLRDYFRKPTGFFANHLKRYSKSRRQAPIYWPLQTPSGSYTLWLYYHRLNDQTLYTCVNNFVEKSKLHEVTEQLNVLRTKTSRSKQEEKDLERLLDLDQELKDFRDELLRVAKFWKPNLNDGVQITAAPLWKLFQHRPWQKTLKDTWVKLEKGDYDWAHLAYSIWPGRVRDACKHDKSLAIAHGLQDLYEAPLEQPKKKRGRTRE